MFFSIFREELIGLLGRRTEDIRPLLYSFLTLFLVGLPIVVAGYFTTAVYDMLAASRQNPWGVVTSIFVHEDMLHFGGNMVLLLAFVWFFNATNRMLTRETLRRRSLLLTVLILASSIIAVTAFAVVSPARQSGASGVVYALEGGVLGFSLANFLPDKWSSDHLRRHFARENRKLVVSNGVLLAFLPFIIFAPAQFLGVAPGVNSFVHGVAFLLGLGGAITYATFGQRFTIGR